MQTKESHVTTNRVSRKETFGSLVDFAKSRLSNLCDAAGFAEDTPSTVATFCDLLRDWRDVPWYKVHPESPSHHTWVSEISDDNTPIEFSAVITEGSAEVRALFEPQAIEPTLSAFRVAGLQFNQRLEREYGANLSRFRRLQPLLLPDNMQGAFAVWNSVVFRRGSRPTFKAYFNPYARGPEHSEDLISEALDRLGMREAWARLKSTVMRRGAVLDELKYLALDLTDTPDARVKIYVRHHASTPKDLEAACSAAKSYRAGEVQDFVEAMSRGVARLQVRAPFTCSAFSGDGALAPDATTVYVPVCAYHEDDSQVRRCVRSYMTRMSFDTRTYDAILAHFANRSLDEGTGLQPWCSYRRHGDAVRLTAYLAIEANRVYRPGDVPAPTSDRSWALPGTG